MWRHRLPALFLVFASALIPVPAARAAGPAPPDSVVASQVRHRLERVGLTAMSDLRVSVSGRTVTLEGAVPSLARSFEAEKEARQAAAGYEVVNRLTVTASGEPDSVLTREVDRRIDKYVFYTIFDWVRASTDHGVVTLDGWVVEPWRKQALVGIAAGVDGVRTIRNAIRVLPASEIDDRIRREAAREIYTDSLLQGYALDLARPIHIVVDGGVVTLEGKVGSEAEKSWAETLVQFHTDAVDVINHLTVSTKGKRGASAPGGSSS